MKNEYRWLENDEPVEIGDEVSVAGHYVEVTEAKFMVWCSKGEFHYPMEGYRVRRPTVKQAGAAARTQEIFESMYEFGCLPDVEPLQPVIPEPKQVGILDEVTQQAINDLGIHLFESDPDGWVDIRYANKYGSLSSNWGKAKDWRKLVGAGVRKTGTEVLLGLATRKSTKDSTRLNCKQLRCLWVDIDEVKDDFYDNFPAGVPMPTQVWSSGGMSGGQPKMHLYWFLDSPVYPDQFPYAEQAMRGLAAALGGDQGCTDVSRALRCVGSINTKYGDDVRNTCLFNKQGRTIRLQDMASVAALDPRIEIDRQIAVRRKERETKLIQFKTRQKSANKQSPNYKERVMGDPEMDMQECSLMNDCLSSGGNVSEPLWFAALTNLAAFSGVAAVDPHLWSAGHPKYSEAETERKWKHALDTVGRFGPVGCAKISLEGGCSGCRFSGAVNAPSGIPYKKLTPEFADDKAA